LEELQTLLLKIFSLSRVIRPLAEILAQDLSEKTILKYAENFILIESLILAQDERWRRA